MYLRKGGGCEAPGHSVDRRVWSLHRTVEICKSLARGACVGQWLWGGVVMLACLVP